MKLLKFEAEWCGPCKAVDRELEKCRHGAELVRINIEEDTSATQLHRVRSVPTMILLNDQDEEIGRLAGRQTAAAIDKFVNDAA